MITRDVRGRFVKGSKAGVSKPGPRKPEAKAKAWRKAVEKGASLGDSAAVDTAILDQLEGLMAQSYATDKPMSTDDRFRLTKLVQEFKRTAKPARRLTLAERLAARQKSA
jgi:hypothetical protein